MYQPATANHLALLEHLTAIEGSAVKRHALWIAEQIAHLAGTPEDAVNYRTLLSEIRTIAELPPHEQTPRANATWCITWGAEWGSKRAMARKRRRSQPYAAPETDHQTLQATWGVIGRVAGLYHRSSSTGILAPLVDELAAGAALAVSLDSGDLDTGGYFLGRSGRQLERLIQGADVCASKWAM